MRDGKPSASQLRIARAYVNNSGIFARYIIDIDRCTVHYCDFCYPEGSPLASDRYCSSKAFSRWAARELTDAEAMVLDVAAVSSDRESRAAVLVARLLPLIDNSTLLVELISRKVVAGDTEDAGMTEGSLLQLGKFIERISELRELLGPLVARMVGYDGFTLHLFNNGEPVRTGYTLDAATWKRIDVLLNFSEQLSIPLKYTP